MLYTLFWLISAHFALDFPFQGDTTAREKSRYSRSDLQKQVPWYYWLSAHAVCHGAAVTFVTGSLGLGLAEVVAHWIIDFAKCEGLFNIHVDQALHLACKVLWVVLGFLYIS